jgi:AraC-like DNA-binding protein
MLTAQDTNFVQKHTFPAPVRNVFALEQKVYARTGDGLYILEGDRWKKSKVEFKKTFVFYDKGFFESDFMPNKFEFDPKPMAYMIPQRSILSASVADLGDRFFVSAGGSLFEYSVNKFYRRRYHGASIRHIYLEDGLSVISTYSGIFINDSLKAAEPDFSNGAFCKIRGRYYLCCDPLFEFVPPAGFRRIPSGVNVFAGYSRKLVEFRNQVYALNTKSVNLLDSSFQLTPIHQGLEYFDLEVVDNELVFCTQTGEVLAFDGQKTRQLCNLESRVRDIYHFGSMVYFSTDRGVFTMQGLKPESLNQLTQTPFTVAVLIDALRNTWISTENGMFLQPDKKKDLIPFIRDVEFNRYALTFHNDTIFAGSVEGMFIIDTYDVAKNFLTVYYNRKQRMDAEERNTYLLIGASMVSVLAAIAILYQRYRKRKARLVLPQKETAPALTLKAIGDTIREHNIMTVEALAEHFKTNTVQLNRQFKNFDTTPGKFMKTVKLDLARDLLAQHVPMEEVVQKTGYSAAFIRKELKMSNT